VFLCASRNVAVAAAQWDRNRPYPASLVHSRCSLDRAWNSRLMTVPFGIRSTWLKEGEQVAVSGVHTLKSAVLKATMQEEE
jgi:hypothetical protein